MAGTASSNKEQSFKSNLNRRQNLKTPLAETRFSNPEDRAQKSSRNDLWENKDSKQQRVLSSKLQLAQNGARSKKDNKTGENPMVVKLRRQAYSKAGSAFAGFFSFGLLAPLGYLLGNWLGGTKYGKWIMWAIGLLILLNIFALLGGIVIMITAALSSVCGGWTIWFASFVPGESGEVAQEMYELCKTISP